MIRRGKQPYLRIHEIPEMQAWRDRKLPRDVLVVRKPAPEGVPVAPALAQAMHAFQQGKLAETRELLEKVADAT